MRGNIGQSDQGRLREQEIAESGVQPTRIACHQPQFEAPRREEQKVIRRSIALQGQVFQPREE